MTYKPLSIYTKKNSVTESIEYFCRYIAKDGYLTKARITKTTFDDMRINMSLPIEHLTNNKGAVQ